MTVKNIFLLFVLSSSLIEIKAQSAGVACSDLGVENGWGTWQASTGTNAAGVPTGMSTYTVPVAPQFNLTSGNGIDPCTPGNAVNAPSIPLVSSGFGQASFQLGNGSATGAVVEQVKFQFTVTPADTELVYSYALMSSDPIGGHSTTDEAYAEFIILDPNGDTIPCSYEHYRGKTIGTGYYLTNSSCGGYGWYKPWTTKGVNLAPYIGQTVTIFITNSDCALGGHYMKSYWDFSCGYNPIEFCGGSPVTICAPVDTFNSANFQWFSNGAYLPNDTNSCITSSPNNSDTLSLYVMVPSGCNYYVQYIMQDSCLTSTQENSILNGISVYPSPASQNIFLDFSGTNFGMAEISLCNVLGEEVFQTKLPTNGKQMLDVSGYAEGIYFMRINTDAGTVTKRIVLVPGN